MARTADDYAAMYNRAQAAGDTEAAGYFRRKAMELSPGLKPESVNPIRENIGAGMDTMVQGVKQVFGRGPSQPEIAEKRQRDRELAEGTTGGGALQVVGAALPAVPLAFLPGANTVAGAALGGAVTGLADLTDDPNVLRGKLMQAGVGGAAGGALQKGVQVAAPALSKTIGAARRKLAEQGLGTASTRQEIAERAFKGAASNPDAVLTETYAYKPRIPGAPQTSAAVSRDEGLLRLERLARETGGDIGNAFREGDAPVNAARNAWIEQQLERGAAQPAAEAASKFAEQSKRGMKVGNWQDFGSKGASVLQKARARATGKVADALEGISTEYQEALQKAMATNSIQPLHDFRMVSLDDRISGMMREGAPKQAKVLRRTLMQVKRGLDNDLDAVLQGDKPWSKFTKGYEERATRAGQLQAGEELLGKIDVATPDVAGEPMLSSMAKTLRSQAGKVDEFGKPVYTPQGTKALGTLSEEIDMAAAPYKVGPKGSATAENLREAERILKGAKQAGQVGGAATGGVIGSVVGGLPGGVAGAAIGYGLQKTLGAKREKAAMDIAQRLFTMVRDPEAAGAALNRMALPPQVKQRVMQLIAERAAGPAGGFAAAPMLPAQAAEQ